MRARGARCARPTSCSPTPRRWRTQRAGSPAPGCRVEIVQWGVDLDRYRPDPDARAAARRRFGVDGEAGGPLDPRARRASTTRTFSSRRSRCCAAACRTRSSSSSIRARRCPPRSRRTLTELGLARATHVVGFVDDDALADLYRAADVVCLDPVERLFAAQRLGGARVRHAGGRVRPPVGARRRCATASTRCSSRSTPTRWPRRSSGCSREPGAAAALRRDGLALTVATMNRSDQLARLMRLYRGVLD